MTRDVRHWNDGEILYSSPLNNQFANVMLNQIDSEIKIAQNSVSALYIEDYRPDPHNLILEGCGSLSFSAQTGSTDCIMDNEVGSKTNFIFMMEILDNFNNSSVDTNIWGTSGTVTENTQRMQLSGTTAIATADKVNAVDYKTLSGDCEIVVRTDTLAGTPKIRFVDGSSIVDLTTLAGQQIKSIYVAKASGTAQVSSQLGAYGSTIDISSLNNWYLDFGAQTNGVLDVYFVGHRIGSATTLTYQTTAIDITNVEIADAAMVHPTLLKFNTTDYENFTIDLSADSGTNFDTGKNAGELFELTNPGSEIVIKMQMPCKTTFGNTNVTTPIITGYGVWYGNS